MPMARAALPRNRRAEEHHRRGGGQPLDQRLGPIGREVLGDLETDRQVASLTRGGKFSVQIDRGELDRLAHQPGVAGPSAVEASQATSAKPRRGGEPDPLPASKIDHGFGPIVAEEKGQHRRRRSLGACLVLGEERPVVERGWWRGHA